MSKLSSPIVPFSIAHPQQSFRLLELPPELLALLTSDEKPEFLELKSSSSALSSATGTNNNASGGGGGGGGGHLFLCTQSLSWAVRQVSTSNSVHVSAPIITSATAAAAAAATSGTGTTTLAAIAKPTSHLELIPAITTGPSSALTSSSSSSSSPWLREITQGIRRIVPTIGEGEETKKGGVSREHVLAALPYPRAWIERGISEALCFSVAADGDRDGDGNHGAASALVYIPSPGLLVDAWLRFTRAAAAAGDHDGGKLSIDAAAIDSSDLQRVLDAVAAGDAEEEEEEEEYSGVMAAGVVRAVLTRFASDASDASTSSPATAADTNTVKHGQLPLQLRLQAQPLTRLLGRALVKADTKAAAGAAASIPKSKLLQKWTALVPLSWERYCVVEELGSGIRIGHDDDSVYWDGGDDNVDDLDGDKGRAGDHSEGKDGGKAGGAGVKKRKWHDMFAKQKS